MERLNRHKNLFFLAIIALSLFAIVSCEYKDNEIYERDLNTNVTPPDIQTVNLDLASDQDTVELLYNRVYFNFKSSNQKIKFVIFYIDGDSIGYTNTNKGYFDLRHDFLYVGYHKLKLGLFTSSGTGSIADSLSAEGFFFSTKEWIIKVNNTSYSNLTTTVSEGFLKLRWEKPYTDVPVSEYIVYRYGTEIGRTPSCEFIDKGHVGEETTYYVNYINPYNGALTTLGMAAVPNEIRIKFTADKNNNYSITWGKLKYYAAVDSLILRGYNYYTSYDVSETEKTTDVSLTGFKISSSYFGQVRKYQLSLTPKYSNSSYDHSSYMWYNIFGSPLVQCVIGYPFPMFQHFMHISNTEVLYHTDQYEYAGTGFNDTLYRYSLTENKIVDRYRYNPANYEWSGDHYTAPTTSPDGKYYCAIGGFSNTLVIGSSNNLSDFKVVDLSSMFTVYDYTLKIPISNVGTGIICGSNKKYLYDFINDSPLGYIQENSDPQDYNLSPDGKYVFLNFWHTLYMYKYDHDTIVSIGTLHSDFNYSFDYFQFMANKPDRALTWSKYSKIFKTINLPDLTVVNSFSLPEDEILDVDYQNNQILSFSSQLLVVRSLTDGTIQYQIPVSFESVYEGRCYLSGNSIFHRTGARYFLN